MDDRKLPDEMMAPYGPTKVQATPREELARRIPGWGADVNPADRPAVPKERWVGPQSTITERQVPRWAREKSPEHARLTPVFGTACPPKGLSGLIRKWAYRYSEGQTLHWMALVFADRVDVIESMIGAALRLRPDNPLSETGIKAELKHPFSRFGEHRNDTKRLPLDIATQLLTWAAPAAMLALLAKGLRTHRRHRRLMTPREA